MSNKINKSIYEERKSDYALSRLSPSTPYIKNNIKLPKKFEWKIQQSRHQFVGSCAAHSLEFAERAIESKQYDRYIDLSPGFIYYLRESNDEGMHIGEACQILKNYGVCERKYFPYDKNTKDLKAYYPNLNTEEERTAAFEIAKTNAKEHKIISYAQIPLRNYDEEGKFLNYRNYKDIVNDIKYALYTISPVPFATLLYDPAWYDCKTDNGDFIYDIFKYKTISRKSDSHAMCIYGWDDEEEVFFVANSWGQAPNNGTIKWKYTNFQEYLQHKSNNTTTNTLYNIMYAYTISDNLYPDKKENIYELKIGYDNNKYKLSGISNTEVTYPDGTVKVISSISGLKEKRMYVWYIDGRETGYGSGVIRPYMYNNELYIPHQIINRFGCAVKFNNNILTIYKDENVLEINPNTSWIKFNNKIINTKQKFYIKEYKNKNYVTSEETYDGTCFLKDSKSLMVPLSFITKIFNYESSYDPETGYTTVTKKYQK